jgi:hypothetical protein
MKPSSGRPREFNHQMRDEFINHVGQGATVEEAARIVGVDHDRYYRDAEDYLPSERDASSAQADPAARRRSVTLPPEGIMSPKMHFATKADATKVAPPESNGREASASAGDANENPQPKPSPPGDKQALNWLDRFRTSGRNGEAA